MTTYSTLSDFFSPLSTQEFFDEIWEKNSFVFEKNEIDVPFDIAEFEHLLNFGNIAYPQIRCYDSNSVISPQSYTSSTINSVSSKIDPELISNLLFENKTVRIADLPKIHLGMNRFAESISHLFGCDVNINSYFSRGPCTGLVGHYDPHHIFAFQLHGEKVWNLGDIVVDTPTKDYSPKVLKSPTINSSVTAKKGQMLYLPPGMWHSTLTEQSSLHITIGIHPPKWSSILEKLVQHTLRRHPIVRASTPMSISQDRCVYGQDLRADLKALVQLLQLEVDNTSPHLHEKFAGTGRKVSLPIQSALQIDEELVTGFELVETKDLIDDIWGLSNFPCSVYFRGSFLKTGKVHTPWDLDIYLIVNHAENALGDITTICDKLSKNYPNLPRIDLAIISKFDLFSTEEQTLRRLLLVNDGYLVKGTPLKSQIVLPPLNEATANTIMRSMIPFVDNKILQLKALRDEYSITSTEEVDSYTKTIAKAMLRTGVFIGVRTRGIFSREIVSCHKHIVDAFPHLEPLSSFMLQRIEGQNFPLQDFIQAAENLKRAVYDEL